MIVVQPVLRRVLENKEKCFLDLRRVRDGDDGGEGQTIRHGVDRHVPGADWVLSSSVMTMGESGHKIENTRDKNEEFQCHSNHGPQMQLGINSIVKFG